MSGAGEQTRCVKAQRAVSTSEQMGRLEGRQVLMIVGR